MRQDSGGCLHTGRSLDQRIQTFWLISASRPFQQPFRQILQLQLEAGPACRKKTGLLGKRRGSARVKAV